MLELSEITEQFNTLVYNSKHHIILILQLILGVWIFNFINWACGSTLNVLGTIPRSKRGILGIIFSWMLHGNFNHLFFNSIPLFVLSLLLISFNKQMFFNASIVIILLEGFSVWLLGRRGNHIGASGLVAGYFGFMLIFAYQTATILSVFPTEAKTSWEAHLFGFLSGIGTFFIISSNFYVNNINKLMIFK